VTLLAIDFAIARSVGFSFLAEGVASLLSEEVWVVDVMVVGRFLMKGDGVKGGLMMLIGKCCVGVIFDRLAVMFIRVVCIVQFGVVDVLCWVVVWIGILLVGSRGYDTVVELVRLVFLLFWCGCRV
jgi:hypothetical protein